MNRLFTSSISLEFVIISLSLTLLSLSLLFLLFLKIGLGWIYNPPNVKHKPWSLAVGQNSPRPKETMPNKYSQFTLVLDFFLNK